MRPCNIMSESKAENRSDKFASEDNNVYYVACIDDNPHDVAYLKEAFKISASTSVVLRHYDGIDTFLSEGVETPDAIFLDRNLPGSAASETRIREIHARHDYCPIIIYTGCLTPSLRSTAAHEGAVAVIEKGMLLNNSVFDLLKGAIAFAPHSIWKTSRNYN